MTSNQSTPFGDFAVTSYRYNGLGDRLQETTNGVTTTFTMDLNAGLTQTLSDGAYTYLYGNGRVAQLNTDTLMTDYFLGDALGSVRQLTDSNGNLTLSKTYDPYGTVAQSAGAGQSSYGYTSEYQDDYNNLVYLRARHYAPGMGRFLTRDTWPGDHRRPHTLNRWGYVEGNPVNFVDPTGHIKQQGTEARRAEGIWVRLKAKGITIYKDWGNIYMPDPTIYKLSTCLWQEGRWDILELEYIEEAADDLKRMLGGWNKINSAVGNRGITINKFDIQSINPKSGGAMAPPKFLPYFTGGDIVFLQSGVGHKDWFKYTFIHEFGHVWDYRTGNRLSLGLMKALGTWVCPNGVDQRLPDTHCWFPELRHTNHDGQVIYPEPPADTCRNPNDTKCTGDNPELYPYSLSYGYGTTLFTRPGAEDWAVSLGYYMYPDYREIDVFGLRSIRKQYVKKQIANLP